MARSLGELFPVIVAVLGVYFLLCAMFASPVLTETFVAPTRAEISDNLAFMTVKQRGGTDSPYNVTVLAGTNPGPGLYAIASALCFGSVLLWSRVGPAAPAAPKQD